MNTFILIGFILLAVAECYQSPSEYWRMLRSSPRQIYQEFLEGRRGPRPRWSVAANIIGFGLVVLGFWRLLAGV